MSIKIKFCDMPRDFDENNNFIVDMINRRCGGYTICDSPDIVLFSCSGTQHYLYDDCLKVFISGEPVAADFNICDYAIAFPYMEYEGRYMKRPAWLTHTPPISIDELVLTDDMLLNRKFCNFVYSNESRGAAVEFRKKFAKKLMEYKPVDCPGKVLNNMPSDSIAPRRGDWREGKIDFIKNYKFTIAFENCKMAGYSTEKIEDPLIAHSMPIYWGDSKVAKAYNTDSFIYVNGREDNLDKVIDEIIYYDTHDDEYLAKLKKNPLVNSYDESMGELEEFIVAIINNGSAIEGRDPLGFGRTMTVPDYRSKDLIRMLGTKVINHIK